MQTYEINLIHSALENYLKKYKESSNRLQVFTTLEEEIFFDQCILNCYSVLRELLPPKEEGASWELLSNLRILTKLSLPFQQF